MALTRNMLKTMGLNEEQINAIIEGHTETVSALTKERDDFKAKVETLDSVTKERDTYKEKAEKAGDSAKVQKEFDDYKAGVEKDKLNAKKRKALDAAFKTAGVQRDTFRSSMLKAWDLDGVELDEKGAIKDVDGLNAAIKKDYADFIATSEDKPLPKNDPPSGGGQTFTRADIEKMSVEEINKNWDAINKQLPNMK